MVLSMRDEHGAPSQSATRLGEPSYRQPPRATWLLLFHAGIDVLLFVLLLVGIHDLLVGELFAVKNRNVLAVGCHKFAGSWL